MQRVGVFRSWEGEKLAGTEDGLNAKFPYLVVRTRARRLKREKERSGYLIPTKSERKKKNGYTILCKRQMLGGRQRWDASG